MPTSSRPARPTVAVIGAGFSGVLTALRLLDAPDGPCVRLVERRPRFAQGAAYSTISPQHLLNVRAANMSAFPEAPSHFVDWLAGQGVRGLAVNVVRIRPVLYSPVITSTPSTPMASWPMPNPAPKISPVGSFSSVT